jgi:hypothetical protein
MTEHKEHKPEKAASAPFTEEQVEAIREIARKVVAERETQLIQELRFGVAYPPKERK